MSSKRLILFLGLTFFVHGANFSTLEAKDEISRNDGKIVLESEESRITYYPDSAFKQYQGGKRYGLVTLHSGQEILGYFEAQSDGMHVYDQGDLKFLKLDEIADIRWLNQILIKLMSGESLVGYLVKENGDQLVIERLGDSKSIITIAKSATESKIVVRNAEYAKRRTSRPRIAVLGGVLFAVGTFKDLFKSGTILGLSFQQNFSRIFGTESYWFPDLRIDVSGISFQNNGFNYQGGYINAGPMWILNGVFEHRGIISVGFLPGIAYERASSPFLPEGASSYTFTFQGAISYEYPIWRRLYIGIDLRYLYSLDVNNALVAAGAAFRTSYQF